MAVPEAEDEADLHFVPYPPIERLAVVGDRRTSATIAADGTVSWMCLPRFDATPVFGCLLDLKKGGFWSFGPEDRDFGTQTYLPGTAVLTTRWEQAGSVIEVTDCMLWPQDERAAGQEHRRVLLRRLRCLSGSRRVTLRLVPLEDYHLPAQAQPDKGFTRLQTPGFDLGLWCSISVETSKHGVGVKASSCLSEGEEIWAVLDNAADAGAWTVKSAEAALLETIAFWTGFSGRLDCSGSRAEQIRLSAIAAYLFTYAPTGAVIAAPTTSLPERIPGEYNYDYRYCWVRDGSLTISLLAELGVIEPVGRFLDWMATRLRPETGDASEMPLQVFYRIDGGEVIPDLKRPEISGYRNCQPVQFGNPVYQMHEIDSFGYLADCALIYAQRGGTLTDAHWTMLTRCADFIAANWEKTAAGIWELMPEQHFVVTKVMSWVTLDRVLAIAKLLKHIPHVAWARVRIKVQAEVMQKGWSENIQSFRQRYDSDAVDGALLLIPLMGFLPPDHARVAATVKRVAAVLSINGLVHRFIPEQTPGRPNQPMGDKEGAFLMCTFWLAQAWHMMGDTMRAEMALSRAEQCTGSTGLFSEAADARLVPGALGNTPLLFSQVEYARAARALG
jgi:GH15 family glucan-1,4-alpha-glucosidase